MSQTLCLRILYLTSPNAEVGATVWSDWLYKSRAARSLPDHRERVLLVEGCSSHETRPDLENSLKKSWPQSVKLPPNATDLIQPADSFIIQNSEEAEKCGWEEYKMDCKSADCWPKDEVA